MTGIIDALPIDQYIRDPAPEPSLSSSTAHTLLTKSAKHAWLRSPKLNPHWTPAPSPASDLGTIAHAVLLEGDESRVRIVDAKDWRTKAAQESRDTAHAEGMIPLLASKWAEVQIMVAVAKDAVDDSELRGLFDGARIETTMVWQDGGIWCRTRPDLITADEQILVDYKSTATNAEPNVWGKGPLLGNGYDLQAVLGLRAADALLGPRPRSFVFMVQEVEPPYAVSFVGVAPTFYEFAARRLAVARERWKACLDENRWPSYPSHICWAEAPEWAAHQWEERQALESLNREEGIEAL